MGLPNIYEASSRVFIDTSSTLEEVLKGDVVRMDTLAEAKIMVKSLLSQPSLEAIAVRTGLLIGGESPREVELVIGSMERKLIAAIDRSQVLQVTYNDADPEIALAVASQFVDGFIEGLLVVNRSDTDTAQEFLEEKLKEYEALLSQAETRLADFKKKNVGQMPGERGDYFSRLQREQEVLNKLNFQLKLARNHQSELNRQLAGEEPISQFGMSDVDRGVESTVDRQIEKFEQELADLQTQYTDSHPDIVRINSILEDLRAQKEEEKTVLQEDGGVLEDNPVYQNIKMQLSAVELELIELRAKRDNQVRFVEDLRNKIDIIPDIEANLTRLNRDYEVNKSQYDALLRRLETARMTEAAEDSNTQVDFRIMDPPTVLSNPVGPNRVLFMTFVLILSIGAGIMLTIFLSFTRPVFFSLRSLEQHFGIPVLGGIRYVTTESDIASARLNFIMFIVCIAGVLGAYGLIISLDQALAKFVAGLVTTIGALT